MATIKMTLFAGASVVSAASWAQGAQTGQQQPANPNQQKRAAVTTPEQPQDIVITARKRSERLFNVPISVTAISEQTIQKRGASTIEDLQYSVPGMSITEFSPGQQRVQLRGVSVYSGLPTVGSYLDEIPLNTELNQSGQDVRLLDVNRIEVLRGPQGTLYGQGSMGGAIRYITNDADLANFGASASGEVGAVNGGGTDWRADGVVNTPLVNGVLGFRGAASYQHFGGWIDNPVRGEKNANGGHAVTARGKLGLNIGERFKLTLMAQYQDLSLGAQNLSDANRQTFNAGPQPFKSRATILNATATYDFGFARLLSSTSYLNRRDRFMGDLTDTFAPFLPLFGITQPVQYIDAVSETRNKIFSEETRLSSNGAGAFNWTIGAFYRNSKSSSTASTVTVPDVIPPGITLFETSGTAPENSRSWAMFGEASYRLTPNLTALAGLRYFSDHRVQDSTSTIFNFPAFDKGSATFHAVSPRFNVSWQPNDLLSLYANVARGFRSGGFNLTSTGGGLGLVPPTFKPDSLWEYEVGGKFRTRDRKLSGELAVYRNEWSNVQTATNVTGLPTNFTTNSGNIAGWGVDGALSYSPLPPLTFTVTGGWNNMAYKTSSAEHLPGDQADYVPRFTGSASVEYRFRLGTLPSFARVDFQHSDRFQNFLRNFQTVPAFSDPQNILNARIGLDAERWTVAIFARNILNRDSVVYPNWGSLKYPARLEPRVVGISLSAHY